MVRPSQEPGAVAGEREDPLTQRINRGLIRGLTPWRSRVLLLASPE